MWPRGTVGVNTSFERFPSYPRKCHATVGDSGGRGFSNLTALASLRRVAAQM